MKKLSIGIVFDDSLDSADGVAQQVKILGGWLSARGHDVSYLVGQTRARQWEGGPVYSLAKNVPVTFNGNRLSIPLPAPKTPIRQLINDKQFDILHVQVPYSPFMAARVINSAGPRTKIVGTFHVFPAGWLARFGGGMLRIITWRSSRKFSKMLSVSSAAAKYASDIFHYQSAILPNTLELAKFKTSAKIVSGRIVFLGRLVDRKGCGYLLEAFAELNKTMPETELVIGGKGPLADSLKRRATELGLHDNVKFLGFVEEKDKPALLASAQIACFPSTGGESFGIVLIEAMAAGAGVVIGGDNPGYASVLGSLPNSLVDVRDKHELAKRMLSFLEDKAKFQSLHRAQQELVRPYDVNRVGLELESIYYQMLADKA